MKEYKTTLIQCQNLIDKDEVCEGCGGKIEPIETVDNAGDPTFWVGCKHCTCFRSGVKKVYWEIARKLVVEGRILPYSHLQKCEYDNTPERLGYYLDSQTAGLSNDIAYIHNLLKSKGGKF